MAELVAETPVIVVGRIDSYRTKRATDRGGARFHWDADLTVTRILKGDIERGKVRLYWLERSVDGVPPYTLRHEGLWFLHPAKDRGAFEASRADRGRTLNA